jgi:hypothetical protein
MMGRMNKRINSLSFRGLLVTEQAEHRLGSVPSLEQAQRNEMKEHGLKSTPSAQKLFNAEAKEHGSGQGPIVIRGTQKQRQEANQIYRAKQINGY